MKTVVLSIAMIVLLTVSADRSALTLGSEPTVDIDFVTVGNPGNLPDPLTGSGAVDYIYQIGKTEVSNLQYVEFLNKVDPTGANELLLYRDTMTSHPLGGIILDLDAPEGQRFYPKEERAQNPANWLSFYDVIRFANWMHNGQGDGDTETGAYTLLGNRPIPTNGDEITRNPGARVFIPSEDEWYKAAYHKNDGATDNYWKYPFPTDELPVSDQPPGSDAPNPAFTGNFRLNDGNDATPYNDGYAVTASPDFDYHTNYMTDVGAYTSSSSAYGTFDQAGNVYEWAEDFRDEQYRGLWGGSFNNGLGIISSTPPIKPRFAYQGGDLMGFRVAAILDTLVGDFNSDGRLDIEDLDLLSETLRVGGGSEFDLNADGRLDTEDLYFWVRDLLQTTIGDSNLDGQFTSSDFVLALTAGEYEDDIAGNSTWSEGDWSGDGDFNSRDFILAFETGGYEREAAANAVPEPSTTVLLLPLLFTLFAFSGRRRAR